MDLYNSLDVVQTLVPAVYKTAQTGVGVDLHGFHSALVEINCGLWTDGSHAFQVEESDVLGSGYTAVADADLQGTEPTVAADTGDNQIYRIGYKGTKRFVRVTTTGSGTTGMAYGVNVIRGDPRKAPVA
jgi:hypothetical protein